MRYAAIMLLFSFLAAAGCKQDDPKPVPVAKEIMRGADLSFFPEIEQTGLQYYDQNGNAVPLLDFLKQSGVNTVRLRLWHTPAGGHSGLQEVTAFSKRLKAMGFKVYLTIHYSDTWADPGKQTKPAAWKGLTFSILSDSVYSYTKRVVALIDPDIIEVGNEINAGLLWPDGNISNQSSFITLLKKGIQGARDATAAKRKIMVHYGGLDGASWFFGILKNNQVDYDILGLSYYPCWHRSSPAELKTILTNFGIEFYKEIVIAETAYPFTLDWNDYTNNAIGLESQLYPGYAATPEGQKQMLADIRTAVEKVSAATGFCYWAPEYVAFRGKQSTSGSSWENMAVFDFSNKALPVIDVFKEKQ